VEEKDRTALVYGRDPSYPAIPVVFVEHTSDKRCIAELHLSANFFSVGYLLLKSTLLLASRFKMVKKSFMLVGAPTKSAQEIEVDLQNSFEYLQYNVAQAFAIAEPKGKPLRE